MILLNHGKSDYNATLVSYIRYRYDLITVQHMSDLLWNNGLQIRVAPLTISLCYMITLKFW